MEACTIPISDGEGDDDMSGKEARQAQLVKRERSPSPDADRELERRLAAHAAGAEVEPVWLSRFESRVGSQLVNLTEAVTSFQGNLQNIDRRLTAVESQPHRDPRVDTLLVQMEELQRNLAAQAGGSREVRPAMPMQQRGPSLDAHPEVDYSHIIFGGWHIDTPRGQIDQDAWTFVRTWQQEHSRHVERLVVYGRRARTAHVYMKESAVEEARNRFYEIRDSYNERVRCHSGAFIWVSPSKSLARRQKNRATKHATDKLAELFRQRQDLLSTLDTDWARQIIWIQDRRVATGTVNTLNSATTDRTVHRNWRDERGENLPFHFNISAISTMMGVPEQDVETRIQSD